MKKTITRKDFLHRSSALALIGIPSLAFAGSIIAQTDDSNAKSRVWPWPYATLDPEAVRVLGHDNYWSGNGCSYATFHAIVSALRTAVGSPYTDLPTEIMIFGHGGGVGWGTLCGALIGASAAMQLVCTKSEADTLISELIGLYTQTDFPSTTSNNYAQNHTFNHTTYDMLLSPNQSNSPLCHVSATKWTEATSFPIGSSERKERCARLSGDVAAMAAQILNAFFAGTFVTSYVAPAEVAMCLSCHSSSGMKANVASKSHCLNCHTDHTSSVAEPQKPTFLIEQNSPNPFSSFTSISFSLESRQNIVMNIYDLNGRLVKSLIQNESYNQGQHSVSWDGRNKQGTEEKPGMYILQCRVGKSMVSRPMIKI